MLLLVLLALGLSAPLGVSEEETRSPLSVSVAEGVGTTKIHGSLAVLLAEEENIGTGPTNPEFIIQAERLRIETDRSEMSTMAVRPVPETEIRTYSESILQGVEHREDYRLSIWPIDSVLAFAHDYPCASLFGSGQSIINSAPLISSRDSNRTQVGDTVQYRGCDRESRLTLEGNFLLRLWEWDSELSTSGETQSLWSGERNPEPLAQETPGIPHVFGPAQEQYIYAYNATLSIPRLEGHYEIYLQEAYSQVSSEYRLSGATGILQGIKFDGQEVVTKGSNLSLTAKGTGENQPLAATIQGTIEILKIDGETVLSATIEHEEELRGFPLFPVLALVAIVFLIGMISATTIWHTNPRIRNGISEKLAHRRELLFNEALKEVYEYSADQPKKAKKWAKIALYLQPSHPEALAGLGQAYFVEGKYQKALHRFQDAIDAIGGVYASPEVPEDAGAFWAVDAAKCLARMRMRANDIHQRDVLTERILRYARLACNIDPEVGKSLLLEDSLEDLEESFIKILTYAQYGLP